ncbi:hypothetical protein CMV_006803 [Castanea mollissima]|uniref:Uncharacterized protein n=1 Tax=Castanea mollissima TaxID=60419 RepID=A0A8J4VT39_9ROSI|nr:hypothetical protein CMV_006803 [Castanea mollissima]
MRYLEAGQRRHGELVEAAAFLRQSGSRGVSRYFRLWIRAGLEVQWLENDNFVWFGNWGWLWLMGLDVGQDLCGSPIRRRDMRIAAK